MFPVILKLHKLIPLLPLIACFSLIYIIQAHKLDSKARNSFLVFLGGMGLWALSSLLMRNSDSATAATLWSRLARAAITLMGASALHFVYELLEMKGRKLVRLAYGVTVIIIIATFFTDLVVVTDRENMWGYFGGRGPLKVYCSIFTFSLAICSLILLFRRRYSRDAAFCKSANITIIAFTLTMIGGVSDLLPTLGVPMYPAGMITHTFFAVLIAYGAFQYRLIGVLARPQPRIVLASMTYALIASGIALTFTDSASKIVFVYLLAFLFVSFNLYHYFDDISYLIQKLLGIRSRPFLHRDEDNSSLLFDNAEIGILALGRQNQLLFANKKSVQMLGTEIMEANSLSGLPNEILRRKLELGCKHRREVVISLDEDTSAEIIPIEFGSEYLGTLICFYPKSGRFLQKGRRMSRYSRLDLRKLFTRD